MLQLSLGPAGQAPLGKQVPVSPFSLTACVCVHGHMEENLDGHGLVTTCLLSPDEDLLT